MSMKEISTDSLDITVEEFDQMNTQHEFSKEYKRNKKRIMKKYRNEGRVVRTGTWKTAVAAAGITIVGTPLVVNAAMDGELFSRLWGTSGRENVESTELTVKDEEIGREYTYTYPKREYVEPEPEKASELVGDNISPEVQKLTLPDGTLLTIKNAVCDQNAVVMEYTLEKPGGVDCLIYDWSTQIGKGASYFDDFRVVFENYYDYIYVDEEKSTKDCLYCYVYMIYDGDDIGAGDQREPVLLVDGLDGTYIGDPMIISLPEPLEEKELRSADGAKITVSPISMFLKADSEDEMVSLLDGMYRLEIVYKDGTSYLVDERNYDFQGVTHECDVETKNYYTSLGKINGIEIVFNRLVEPEKIDSILYNDDVVYKAE